MEEIQIFAFNVINFKNQGQIKRTKRKLKLDLDLKIMKNQDLRIMKSPDLTRLKGQETRRLLKMAKETLDKEGSNKIRTPFKSRHPYKSKYQLQVMRKTTNFAQTADLKSQKTQGSAQAAALNNRRHD